MRKTNEMMIDEIRRNLEPWEWMDEDKVDDAIMNWCNDNEVLTQNEISAIFDYCAKNLY